MLSQKAKTLWHLKFGWALYSYKHSDFQKIRLAIKTVIHRD